MCVRARATAHVCTKRTANASSPSPSPPNNRRGTIIPLLHSQTQDSPLHFQAIPRPHNATPGLFALSPRLVLYGFGMSSARLPTLLRCAAPRNPTHMLTDCLQQAPNQPRPYSGNYLPNGGGPSGPVPGAVPLDPNRGRVIQQGSVRVLCIADVRGRHSNDNDVVRCEGAPD